MNVDEVLDQAALPEAEPDVDRAWATVVHRVQHRRSRRRVLVGSCAVAVIALAGGAIALQQGSGDMNVAVETEDPKPTSGDAMREVEYLGTRFAVPSSLPVSRPDEYEFHCLTYEADGVFLAPEDVSIVGASCPATLDDYGSTIHVQPLLVDGPADRTVEGDGPDERWVISTETNRWYEAALPHYGLRFTFYELDEAVREAVLSSVRLAGDRETNEAPTAAEIDDYPIGEPLGSDMTLVVGERRSLIVNLHCGMRPLVDFNGGQWALAETPAGPVPNTGAGEPIPEGWPRESPESVRAYVSLGEDDTIRYSLPSGIVIAVYRRAPAPTQVPGCD